MAKIISIDEHFQHFLAEMKESFSFRPAPADCFATNATLRLRNERTTALCDAIEFGI
jgi:hypothetical protein